MIFYKSNLQLCMHFTSLKPHLRSYRFRNILGCLCFSGKKTRTLWTLKEWVSFFLSSWGMNRSVGQTNLRFTSVLFALRSDSFPMNPEKKTLIPYICGYLQCFHQRSFIKFSEKSYKFKYLLFTGTLNLIWCKSPSVWSTLLTNYLMTVPSDLNPKFSHCSMKEIWYHCKYCEINHDFWTHDLVTLTFSAN